jgi:hypothetical protein
MWAIVDKIPYSILIVIAVFMILAPFSPMPHVLEKLIMLKNGTLTKVEKEVISFVLKNIG